MHFIATETAVPRAVGAFLSPEEARVALIFAPFTRRTPGSKAGPAVLAAAKITSFDICTSHPLILRRDCSGVLVSCKYFSQRSSMPPKQKKTQPACSTRSSEHTPELSFVIYGPSPQHQYGKGEFPRVVLLQNSQYCSERNNPHHESYLFHEQGALAETFGNL